MALTPEEHVAGLISSLGEDVERDGLAGTPSRVVKALRELTSGYAQDPKALLDTVFQSDFDELISLDHVPFVSLCEHHLLPFQGVAHMAYVPNGRGIVGISKLARLVDCFARRLQVQERMASQIADTIEEVLNPRGVAVVLEAEHSCVALRGIQKRGAVMRTSVMRGVFKDDARARAEFLSLVGKD